VVQGPDGALYVTIGNHTKLAEDLVKYADGLHQGSAPHSPYDYFAEDMIDARMWDPRGHAVGIYAPGGVVLRVDPETAHAQVMAGGFRNAYDLCFDSAGNLFTYDSDMEWDIGAPWYRAPRVVHVVQGGEYGWRSGSGCWPEWYADSLPPACETDSASPTGMLSGHQSAWPEPWKSTLFAADWTYGRILAVTLEESGSTFIAQWHPWLSGRPMPVTDMAWGPDGQMYLVTGGRGTQSGLYRVSHAAGETATATSAGPSLRSQRERLQALQVALSSPELESALASMFAALDSPDRWVRFAARAAMEHQPVEAWRDRIPALPTPRARIEGALALARRGNGGDAAQVVALAAAALGDQKGNDKVSVSDSWVDLTAIRAMQVAMARHPQLRTAPLGAQAAALGFALAQRAYQHGGESPAVWAGLELACGLNSPAAVPLAVECLAQAPDRASALRYASMLRHTKDGWSEPLRQQYWAWLDGANDRAGGFSLSGFMAQVKREAAENVGRPASPPVAVAKSGATDSPDSGAPPIAKPTNRQSATTSVLHAWTLEELLQAQEAAAEPRDLARGARIFREATCILCHRFAGEGASTGPDLTGVGARFTRTDLLRAILEPSADVSDQYRDSAIATADGDLFVGRVVGNSAEAIQIRTNPLSLDTDRVLKSNITSITPIATSSMPRGLLDSRSRQEVLDLLAYLERGGVEPLRTMPK
jgi:putative heme-binding domain-containing protein